MGGRLQTRQKNIPVCSNQPTQIDTPSNIFKIKEIIVSKVCHMHVSWVKVPLTIEILKIAEFAMGGNSTCNKLSFLVTWDDPLSGISRSSTISKANFIPHFILLSFRQFNLIFNPEDSTVEMSDNRSRKTFLKKTVTTEVPLRGVYIS